MKVLVAGLEKRTDLVLLNAFIQKETTTVSGQERRRFPLEIMFSMLSKNENDHLHLFVILYKQLILTIYCYFLCAWAPKNWCFQIMVLEEALQSSRAARKSNQSILKKISPEYSLEGLMLKLQNFSHQCEEPTDWKRPWSWEKLRAGGEGDDRGWDGWMAPPTQWTGV